MTVNPRSISRKTAPGSTRPGRSARARGRASLRHELTGVFRRTILDAAEHVLGVRGFSASRMTEIAERAGLAAGTLYNYFDSKEAIFSALVEHHAEEFCARLSLIAASPGTPPHKLVALTRATFAYIDEHGALMSLLLHMGGAPCSARRDAGGPGPARLYRRYLAPFEATLGQAAQLGLLRDEPASPQLARVLAGAINGVVRGWLEDGRPGRLADHADLLVDLFLGGAGARP